MLEGIYLYLLKKYNEWTDVDCYGDDFPGYGLLKDIRWTLQKIFRGYNDWDLWDLDHNFAKLILKRLKAFKQMEREGCPSILDKDHNELMTQENWEKILDAMIKGFELHLEMREGSCECCEKSDTKALLNKHWRNQQKINWGLYLFGKYFGHLWD